MDIVFHRGDIHRVSFIIRDANKNPITFVPDDIYFTVKRYANEKKILFQKSLSVGSILPGDSQAKYYFQIEPEDTNDLSFKNYAYDIEIVALAASIKKTFAGQMVLLEEVTHACNERTGS